MVTLALLALAAWVYLVAVHHGFWRADQRLPDPTPDLPHWPPVTAVVPARNEAETVAACVQALVSQDYPGRFEIIVIDDASTDDTAERARIAGAGRARVKTAPPLRAGWTGKLAALQAGIAEAGTPDFYWFTDADVVHAPGTLRALVAQAETRGRDMVSLMVLLNAVRFWERLLIPAFVFFFQMLYPFRAVNDSRASVAGAAGGCILLRRTALERAGGLAAIRDALIDDCALAGAVKRAGGRLWLGLTTTSRSLRAADGLTPLWRMVQRTAFTQLRYSYLLLTGTLAGLALLFLVPPLAVLAGSPAAWPGAAAWVLMAAAYAPTLRLYGLHPVQGLALPLVGGLYGAMTASSALAHAGGRGGGWKGRHYAASAGPANLPESPS
jgi:hopene-associated glycosyltransferase HpnB